MNKVIIPEGMESEVSKKLFLVLANVIQYNQKFRKEFGSANKLNVYYWERIGVELLKNPLLNIEDVIEEEIKLNK